MRLLKRLLFAWVLVTSCFSAFEIAGKEFDLQADHVIFDQDSGDILATKNVHVLIDGYDIRSDYFSYDASTTEILVEGNTVVLFRDIELRVESLSYEVDHDKGHAFGAQTVIDGVFVDAADVELSEDKITLKSIRYSACTNQPHRHYEFYADEMYYDRGNKTVLSQNMSFYFYQKRLFKHKQFTYDLTKDNSSSFEGMFPTFGNSRVDGSFFTASRPYYSTSGSSGHFDLGVSEERGTHVGLRHRFELGEAQELYLRVRYNFNAESIDSGFDHFYYLKKPKYEARFLEKLFSSKESSEYNRDQWYFRTSMHRDLIQNDTLVSKYPELSTVYDHFFPRYQIQQKVGLTTGYYKDFKATGYRQLIEAQTTKRLLTTSLLHLDAWVLGEASFYRQLQDGDEFSFRNWWSRDYDQFWKRSYFNLTVAFNRGILKELGYSWKLYDQGQSPFEFDSYNQRISDELYSLFSVSKGVVKLNLRSYYQLNDERFRSARVEFYYRIHCWDLYISNDFVLGNTRFGFSFL